MVNRGGVYLVDWGEASHSMEKKRPSLVVQNNAANRFSPYTIVVAIHQETDKHLPVTVSVPKGIAGLHKNSIIDCGHIYTLPQDLLEQHLGDLPYDLMAQVNIALRKSLQL